MEGVLTKLADVTYDFVGVLLPGLVLLLMLSLQWHVHLVSMDRALTWEALARSVVSDINALEAHRWVGTLAVLGASYLLGRAMLYLAKKGLPGWAGLVRSFAGMLKGAGGEGEQGHHSRERDAFRRFLHRAFLLSTPERLLRGHERYLGPLLEICARRLGLEPEPGKSDGWRTFQLVATRTLAQGEVKTRHQIHQYKYTLDRSLATVFALGFWSSVALIASSGQWLLGLAEAVGCLSMAFVFNEEHASHWGLWADLVIADTYAYLRETKE